MAVAALILGIIAFCISFIPLFGIVALIPAILSLVFAIIAIAKKNPNIKAMAITGLIISSIAIIIIIFWIVILCIVGISTNIVVNSYENSQLHDEINTDEDFQLVYHVNEDIKTSDRVFKIDKVEKKSGTEEYAPKKNNQFVFVTVSMKNTSTYNILYSCNDFSLCSNGNKYKSDYYQVKSNTTFTMDELKKGETKTGILCFEVPNDCSEFTLQYERLDEIVNVQFNL